MAAGHIKARIAGIEFGLEGGVTTMFLSPETRPVCMLEPDPVEVAWEGGVCYLVVDHRPAPRRPSLARVELWLPAQPAEAPLGGLFVVAEASFPAPIAPSLPTLAALVDAIRGHQRFSRQLSASIAFDPEVR